MIDICGNCKYARKMPGQDQDERLYCFAVPPVVVMVPMMVPPTISNPKGGQQIVPLSCYPSVTAEMPGCGMRVNKSLVN